MASRAGRISALVAHQQADGQTAPAAPIAAAAPTAAPPAAPSDLLSRLTPREHEVLALFIETCHDKKVAACLGISAQSREELVKHAISLSYGRLSWLK